MKKFFRINFINDRCNLSSSALVLSIFKRIALVFVLAIFLSFIKCGVSKDLGAVTVSCQLKPNVDIAFPMVDTVLFKNDTSKVDIPRVNY